MSRSIKIATLREMNSKMLVRPKGQHEIQFQISAVIEAAAFQLPVGGPLSLYDGWAGRRDVRPSIPARQDGHGAGHAQPRRIARPQAERQDNDLTAILDVEAVNISLLRLNCAPEPDLARLQPVAEPGDGDTACAEEKPTKKGSAVARLF
jgi:hypothetical protein